MKVVVPSLRVSKQHDITPHEYSETMMMELEVANVKRMQAFNHMLVQKKKMVQSYKKRVRNKSFKVGDLFWKVMILPMGIKDKEFGKWSPN